MLLGSFLVLIVLIFAGIPIAFSIGLTSLIVMQPLKLPVSLAITQLFTGLESFTLMAIPFFILAGDIMTQGGSVKRMVAFANLRVGRLRGGLRPGSLGAARILAGGSGSGVADCSAG